MTLNTPILGYSICTHSFTHSKDKAGAVKFSNGSRDSDHALSEMVYHT